MSIYAVGDLHLSFDPRIEKPMEVFGPEWKDHAQRLEAAWREEVKAEDTVIVAGDISWGLKLEEAMADLRFIAGLPGQKVLIKGNHDLWWTGITRLNALFPNVTFLQNSTYEAEGWFICGSRGWLCPGSDDFDPHDRVLYEREEGRLRASLQAAAQRGARQIIGVTHYPPTNDKMQPSAFTKLFSEAGVQMAVYGHLHGRENYRRGIRGDFCGVSYDLVSLDYLGCRMKKLV